MPQRSKIQEIELSNSMSSLIGNAFNKRNNKETFEEIKIDA